jgi:hypothetical protein
MYLSSAVVFGISLLTACGEVVIGADRASDPAGNDHTNGEDHNPGGGDDGGRDGNPPTNPGQVSLSVDQPAFRSNLGVDSTVVVTAVGSNGFSGEVALTASVVDGTGAPLLGWKTTIQSVTLTENGTAKTNLVVRAPGNTPSLTVTIKIAGRSSAGPAEVTVAATFRPLLVVTFGADAQGNCAYPVAPIDNPIRIIAGREIWVINDTTKQMQIEVNGVAGFPRQVLPMQSNAVYSGIPSRPGDQSEFYCYNGPDTIGEGPGAQRPYLRVE